MLIDFPSHFASPGWGWSGLEIPALEEEPSRAKLFVGHASLTDSERIRVLLLTTECTVVKNSIKFHPLMGHNQDDVLSIHRGSKIALLRTDLTKSVTNLPEQK